MTASELLSPPVDGQQTSTGSTRWLRVHKVGLIVVMVLGAGLRWWDLGQQSLWFDEGFTAWVVSLSPRQIGHVIAADVSPPLYYYLLRAWVMLWGNSEVALRSLSALAATLSLPLFAWLAIRLLKSPQAVISAATLFAFTVLQVQFAQEARFYALMSLLGLAGFCALLHHCARPTLLRLAVLISVLTIGVYVNNMMWFYLAALNIAWLILPGDQRTSRRWRDMLLVNGSVVLLFLPWVPSLIGQLHRVHDSFWAKTPHADDLLQTAAMITGANSHYLAYLFNRLPIAWEVREYLAEWIAVALLVIAIFIIARNPRKFQIARQQLALAVYALLPVVAIFAYSQVSKPIFLQRVFVPSSALIPIVLMAPLALGIGKKRLATAVALVAVIFATVSMIGATADPQPKEQWRQAVASLLEPRNGQPTRLIVFVANEGETLFDYYAARAGCTPRQLARRRIARLGLPGDFYSVDPPVTTRQVRSPADLNTLKVTLDSRIYQCVDLVLSHDTFSDPQGLTCKLLDETCALVAHETYEKIQVLHYRTNAPLAPAD